MFGPISGIYHSETDGSPASERLTEAGAQKQSKPREQSQSKNAKEKQKVSSSDSEKHSAEGTPHGSND